MEEKLFTIIEDDTSEPYALIIKSNDKLIFSKLELDSGLYFRDVLKSSLIIFIKEQSQEFIHTRNSFHMSEDMYLWISTEDINFHKYLLSKLQIINNVELIDSSANKNNSNLKEELNSKFNYYLLQNELNNNGKESKKLKI
jgi:hypothetical protein